ncbi:peroxisomal acyl-coenzyme A oxidase 1-like [Cicer arietinum]|uniref:peroxisomal acyl-coenzyme A oxidase 1-like n=1 Tax=Cicer arietinum TaxID=3827 RepID=UPI003CC6AD6A
MVSLRELMEIRNVKKMPGSSWIRKCLKGVRWPENLDRDPKVRWPGNLDRDPKGWNMPPKQNQLKIAIRSRTSFSKVSQITREGKHVQSNVPRQLVYGTMVYVRQTIVSDASTALSRAVCIATRYSVVRRQFGANNGGLETQVIDYKTQQARLFPLLASAYAFRFVGEWLKWLYTDVMKRLQANDFSTLPEAHACTAGLKSLTTSGNLW